MEIYINGRQLHIADGEVTLNWSNIRFSEAVADEWSTEIELPNDTYNIDLLDCYGLLDRGPIYNHKVSCSVLVDEVAKDGYMQVLSIEEDIIKARVYILSIPYAILDKKVSEYYPHEDVVFRWDRFSPITTNIAAVDEGIIPYDYTETDFYSNIMAQWHSSVHVQKVLQNIETAEDITLPAVYNTLYQLSARKKVCPSNRFQVMMGNFLHGDAITDKSLELSGGQHITNDFKSSWSYADFVWDFTWSDWLFEGTNEKWMEESSKMDRITFNRHCVAHIKVYASASQIGAILIPKRNDESLAPAPASSVPVLTSYNWTIDDILIFDDYVEFENGDEFRLHYSGSAQTPQRGVRYTVVIEYEDYEWNEDDYDEELVYIPAPFGIWGIIRLSSTEFAYDFKYDFDGSGDGTNSPMDYSFTYFGAYTNLDRDTTVRDYITSLCWIHNQKLHLDKNELIFMNAMTRDEIVANLDLIDPSSGKLGQTNTIGYRDSKNPTKFDIDNEFLDQDKELHENEFYTGDIIPQYSYEMTYSENATPAGEHWITDINVNFDDLSPVIMNAVQEGNRYWLRKSPDIVGFGLPALRNAQEIKGRTLRDISDLDFVYIDGHKYMLVEGNIDLNTYITEFTAIQCDSVFDLVPQVVITHIYTSGTSADVEYTVTGIFITGTTLTIYSDAELTNVVAVIEGTAADTQIQSVTGLTPDTSYWAVVTATDAQGNEGTSQSRMFRTAVYQFRGSVQLTDDYDTLNANVNVICSGATFTQTGIEFSTTSDFSGDIITGSSTTPPADTFSGDVAGFEPNTTYYYRFFATSDYGTQYYTPLFNTITTMYAPPTLTITLVESTPDSLTLSFLYEGDYPFNARNYSCAIGKADGTGTVIDIDLHNLREGTPDIVTVPNLQVGTEYVVTWDVEYYRNEVSVIEYFTTQAHNFDFATHLDGYTDTTARITTHAEQITTIRLNVTNIGINLNTTPDFESGRDIGGNLGSGDIDYRLSKTGLTEHTVYYYRPWIETSEFGREYGPTASFETLYSMPTVTLTTASVSYDSITVYLNYYGNYPVPQNGVLYLEKEGVVLQRLDASRLRPNDDTVFTFTNLDELTTYTIRYAGDYYVQREAITDTITATTGERINITWVNAWSANGQCTHTIVVESYEAIDTFNCTFNNPDITVVDEWTINGSTIEGVTQGYDYNENPYTLYFEVTIGGGYTVTRSFNFSVPYQNLTADHTSNSLNLQYPTKKGIIAFVIKGTTQYQFDCDYSNSLCTMTNINTDEQYTVTYSYDWVNGSYWTYGTRLIDLPVGTYRVTHKLTNVVQQSATSTTTQTYTWDGAVGKSAIVGYDYIKFNVYYNSCYDDYTGKHIDLVNNGTVTATYATNISGEQVIFTGLPSYTNYDVKIYYSADNEPVIIPAMTLPHADATTATDITSTTATINIIFS